MITLDHADGLQWDEMDVAPPEISRHVKEEHNAFAYSLLLWEGLSHLNKQLLPLERDMAEIRTRTGAADFTGFQRGVILSFFHWYAVSACNYTSLIGWLTHRRDLLAARAYSNAVVPGLREWRDKVAAHLAIADSHPDTIASKFASVSNHLTFFEGRFVVHVNVSVGDPGGDSWQELPMWSLTQLHTELARRYEPQSDWRPPP